MVHIERTPLSEIKRAEVYVNTQKKPLSQIVAEKKPHIAMTAAFYDPGEWVPVCPVKADGKVLFSDPEYNYWAIAWNAGADAQELLVPTGGACAGPTTWQTACWCARVSPSPSSTTERM